MLLRSQCALLKILSAITVQGPLEKTSGSVGSVSYSSLFMATWTKFLLCGSGILSDVTPSWPRVSQTNSFKSKDLELKSQANMAPFCTVFHAVKRTELLVTKRTPASTTN